MDIVDEADKTGDTDHDDTATVWPQAGNDAREVHPMRVWKPRATRPDYLTDAISVLGGWTRDGVQLTRVLACDDSQHAALTERIKVAADTLHLRPRIDRSEGQTRILLDAPDSTGISDGEVALAARIEDAYRTVTGPQQEARP